MESLSDQKLLFKLQLNDHSAFDILFNRYWQRLYQSACARLKDSDLSQDIVQEIFIKLWQRRASLQINGPLENYLQSAVRLSVISHYRSTKSTTVQLYDALERINLIEDSIESLNNYIELEKTLQLAIEIMPHMLKRVYQLRSENHSVKAIACELGLADQTVKNYIGEVLRRLRVAIVEKHPEKHLAYLALILAVLHK